MGDAHCMGQHDVGRRLPEIGIPRTNLLEPNNDNGSRQSSGGVFGACSSSCASIWLTDYSQFDMLGIKLTSVNLREEKSPGSLNR